MKNISSAFVKAQKEFGVLLKDSNNPFFKSKYADLSSCVNSVLDALNNNGIGLIQNCHESNDGVIVETIFLHESGESLSCGKLHVPAVKHDPQQYGSALTYARRYSLMAACGIAPEDDDGNAASKPIKTSPAPNLMPPKKLQAHELAEALKAISSCTDIDALKATFAIYYMKASDAQIKILTSKKDEIKSLIESQEKKAA